MVWEQWPLLGGSQVMQQESPEGSTRTPDIDFAVFHSPSPNLTHPHVCCGLSTPACLTRWRLLADGLSGGARLSKQDDRQLYPFFPNSLWTSWDLLGMAMLHFPGRACPGASGSCRR